ncbi:daunorubicin resistance protein DrrA family ABC transporter ATP-binding protein [Angustibacter speluncae]
MISLEGLRKSYGSQVVLDHLDLAVGAGVLALLGPNGAGKTTLVNVLATLTRPDAGTARVLGHDVVREPGAVRRLIGVTGQYAAVDEVLTGLENLVMVARLQGLRPAAARRRASGLLERFDLADAGRRRVGTYSGGMRRRLDLAMSLVRSPRVVFLDEPTTGLDARSRQTLWDEVRSLAAEGSSVLLTTQYLDEADALADRVVVLDHGRVVADGSPDRLKAQVGAEVVELLDADGRVERTLETDGTASDVARVLAGLPPDARVAVRRPTMDEVFLALTGREEVAA